MIARARELRAYQLSNGESPFWSWFHSLKDVRVRSVLLNRLQRFAEGNPGYWRALGSGIFELKIDFGPGYRIYYGEEGAAIIILLCGGDKTSQKRDIRKARAYWEDYKRRAHGT